MASPPRQRACPVGRMRISLSDTPCGRETAKAMISAMSSAVIAVAVVELLDALLRLAVGDVVGELGRDGAGLDDDHAHVGLQLLAQRLRPAVQAPLGGCVAGVAGASGAAGDRRDVDEVAAAVAELVEEDLGRGHRAEQVDLDHLALLGTLLGGERGEQHHAGVVDQDVGAAELVLDALGGGDERVAVGDVGLDGDRAVAELVGQRLDAVGAARQQRDAVAVGGQRTGGGLADARRGAGDDRDAAGGGFGAHDIPLCPRDATL